MTGSTNRSVKICYIQTGAELLLCMDIMATEGVAVLLNLLLKESH